MKSIRALTSSSGLNKGRPNLFLIRRSNVPCATGMQLWFRQGPTTTCEYIEDCNFDVVYFPPNHPDGTLHKTKGEAVAAELLAHR